LSVVWCHHGGATTPGPGTCGGPRTVTVADATSPDEEVIDNPCPAHPGRGGAPVWCHPCGDRIAAALDRLPGLAGELALRGISDAGRLAATGEAGRATHAKVTGSPSGSPAWDAADEIIEWAVSVEDQLRAHLHHARVVRATVAASAAVRVNYLDRSVSYLMQWISALLAAPFALDAGRQALELARRAERAAGLDRLVHHLPVPCPSCDTRALTREDGAEQVECRACGDVWPEDTYRRLTLVLASDYRDVAGAR
jgi:ribosomal protein L37AE/L43A